MFSSQTPSHMRHLPFQFPHSNAQRKYLSSPPHSPYSPRPISPSKPLRIGSKNSTHEPLLYSSPLIQRDLDLFSRDFKLPNITLPEFLAPYTYDPSMSPDSTVDQLNFQNYREEVLNVRAIHGIGPRAQIVLLASTNFLHSQFADAINYALEQNVAELISTSYNGPLYTVNGLPNAGTVFFAIMFYVLEQEKVVGVGKFFASGDSRDTSENPHTYYEPYDYEEIINTFTTLSNAVSVGSTTLAVG